MVFPMNRLTEPSTWAGLGVTLASLIPLVPADWRAFGGALGTSEVQVVLAGLAIGCGVVAVWKRERSERP